MKKKKKILQYASEYQKKKYEEECLNNRMKTGKLPKFRSKQSSAFKKGEKAYLSYKRGKIFKSIIGAAAIILGATGFGKTIIAAMLIKRIWKKYKIKKKVLILTHRDSILSWLWEEMFFVLHIKPSIIRGGLYYEYDNSIVIAMVQTIHSRLTAFGKDYFELIIADESHHSVANTWLSTLIYFNCFKLGLTATADRADNKSVIELYNNNVLENITLWEAIKYKWVSNFNFINCFDNSSKLLGKGIHIDGRKLTAKNIDKNLFIKERTKAIIKNVKKYFPGHKTAIAFAGNITYAKYITKKLSENKIPTTLVLGDTATVNREVAFENLKKGKINVLTNVNVVSEGFNVPAVSGVMFLNPVNNFAVFLQRIGRALRMMPGKRNAIILDFASAYYAIHKILRYIQQITGVNLKQKIRKNIGKKVYIYSLGAGCKYIMDEKQLPYINETIRERQCLTEVMNDVGNRKRAEAIIKEIETMIREGATPPEKYPEIKQMKEIIKKKRRAV